MHYLKYNYSDIYCLSETSTPVAAYVQIKNLRNHYNYSVSSLQLTFLVTHLVFTLFTCSTLRINILNYAPYMFNAHSAVSGHQGVNKRIIQLIYTHEKGFISISFFYMFPFGSNVFTEVVMVG